MTQFFPCPSSSIKTEIRYLQEAESLSYYLLLQKTHMHLEGREVI